MMKNTVLVVEDENIIAKDIENKLKRSGYVVVATVSSGEEAIKKTAEACPDLVLMDIMLAGDIDGIQAAEQIHTQFDIPVIYLTAYADENTLQRAKVTEPFGYLLKPFSVKEMRSTIETALYKNQMERKLKESEERYSTTLRSIGEGVIATNVNELVTFMNPEAEALTGWKQQEALGREFTDICKLIDEETREVIECPVTEVLREGNVIDLGNQVLLVVKQGQEIPIDARVSPVKNDVGDVIGVVVVCRDITERKQAAEKLQQAHDQLESRVKERTKQLSGMVNKLAEEVDERQRAEAKLLDTQVKYQLLIENASTPMAAISKSGVYMVVNSLGANQLIPAAEPQEIVGRSVHDIFPLQNANKYMEIIDTVCESGKGVTIEHLMQSGNGERWYWSDFQPIQNARGGILGVHIIAHDITERKRAEESLHRHTERLKILHEIDRAILSAQSPKDIAQAALRHIQLLLPCYRASVELLDFEAHEGIILAVRSKGETQVRADSRFPLEMLGDIQALYRGELRVIEDSLLIPQLPHALKTLQVEGVRSMICVPLMSQGELIGTLNLGADSAAAFNEEHIEIAREVANSLSIGIQQARLFEQVHTGRQRLQSLSHQLVDVQETERRHIARELHDEIGQTLTGIKLSLEMIKRLEGNALTASVDEVQMLVDDLTARVRDLSFSLRPSMLDDLGLLPTLLWHLERYTAQTNVHVAFNHIGLEGQRFTSDVETAVYRISQEALTNIARYADVSKADMNIWADESTLTVKIEDKGVGFDSESVGGATFSGGVIGMRERAVLLNGQLTIESAPGAGTCLTATFPLAGQFERRRRQR